MSDAPMKTVMQLSVIYCTHFYMFLMLKFLMLSRATLFSKKIAWGGDAVAPKPLPP